MYSLVIDDIQPEDAGEYECVAINDFGETSCKANLNFEQNGITPDLIEEMESTPIALEEVEGTVVLLRFHSSLIILFISLFMIVHFRQTT